MRIPESVIKMSGFNEAYIESFVKKAKKFKLPVKASVYSTSADLKVQL